MKRLPIVSVGEGVGSDVCLSCGLCCDGAIHEYVTIGMGEVPHVRSLGLDVTIVETEARFLQPCTLFRESRCSVYGNRPVTCRKYVCKLLKKVVAGNLSKDAAIRIVEQARILSAAVQAALPAGKTAAEVSDQIGKEWSSGEGMFGSLEGRTRHADLFLSAAVFVAFLKKNFHDEKATVPKKDSRAAGEEHKI